jgi:hypothetical protein
VIDMERVWLYNPDTRGYFHCPADALDYWLGMGYQMSDPPEEENLAVAERRAWEKQQAEQAAAAEAAKPKKTVKPAASGETQES